LSSPKLPKLITNKLGILQNTTKIMLKMLAGTVMFLDFCLNDALSVCRIGLTVLAC